MGCRRSSWGGRMIRVSVTSVAPSRRSTETKPAGWNKRNGLQNSECSCLERSRKQGRLLSGRCRVPDRKVSQERKKSQNERGKAAADKQTAEEAISKQEPRACQEESKNSHGDTKRDERQSFDRVGDREERPRRVAWTPLKEPEDHQIERASSGNDQRYGA